MVGLGLGLLLEGEGLLKWKPLLGIKILGEAWGKGELGLVEDGIGIPKHSLAWVM